MRTKLFTLIAAIAFTFGATNVFAEGGEGGTTPVTANEGKVNLSVHIYPIQTLVIKNEKDVVLEYKTKEHFKEGVSKKVDDHIEVYSTGGFEIKAKTSNPNLVGTNPNTKTIASSDIKLLATNGSKSLNMVATDVGNMVATQLDGTTEVSLLTSSVGGVDKTFNVEYSAAGGDKYINHYVNSENPTKYTTEVTYTIVAK